MRLVPSRRFRIVSTEMPPEVIKRLEGVVRPQIGLFERVTLLHRVAPPNPVFAGYVGTDQFRIQRIINYRSSANPELVGALREEASNTVVEVRAGLTRHTEIVYCTFVYSLIVLFLATSVLFLSGYLGVVAPLLVAGALCVVVLGTIGGFRAEVDRSQQLLTGVLTRAPADA